jgi:limonene-1,2-epoxide hydrolase
MLYNKPLFPEVADTTHATEKAAAFFHSFFTVKSQHDIGATMEHFSQEKLTYIDAILGWLFDSHGVLKGVFEQYMPQWPDTALSYATRIIGDENSALVAFTDTPELFGAEIRILGAIDMKDGQIIRWVDYWDGRHFGAELAAQLRTPADDFPIDFKEATAKGNASAKITGVANKLQAAITNNDAKAAAELFTYDAVYEDMTLRSQVLGNSAIERYLGRVLTEVPYGVGSTLSHVVGGDMGGGYEWKSSPAYSATVKHGVTALELDEDGQISRLTTVWDGSMISDENVKALMVLSLE